MIKQTLIASAILLGLTACQNTDPIGLEHPTLEGTWYVEVALDMPVIDYSPAQLIFAADGSLTGNNSCNNFFGQYQQNGEALTLAPAGSTRKACVDALMDQEQRVMQAMPQVKRAQMTQGKLNLLDDKGITVLVLSKM